MSTPKAQFALKTVKSNTVIWLVTLLAFAVLGAFLTPEKSTPNRRLSDADLIQTGTWEVLNLASYSEGHAIFGRDVNAKLTANFQKYGVLHKVTLKYYDYGVGQNTLKITAGNQTQSLTYGGTKGVFVKSVEFSPPVQTDQLEISFESIGQPRVLIDHISYTQSGYFDVRRVLWQMALFLLFSLSLWFASLMVKAPQSSSGRIYQSIDILRGIGVILVVMLHATGYAGLPDLSKNPLLRNVADQGHYGVEIFYVVSAYTLTYSLASAIRRNQLNKISLFWNRRFNRIVPTFLFCILTAYILRNFLNSSFTTENAIPTILKYLSMGYVFERDVLQTPIGHSVWWSISTEFQFYIVMPLLFLPIMSYLASVKMQTRQRYFVAAAIIIGGILVSLISRGALTGKPWIVYTVLYHFDAFAIGIATAILMMKPDKSPPAKTELTENAVNTLSDSNNSRVPSESFSPALKGLTVVLIYAALILAVACSKVIGNALPLPKNLVDTRLFIVLICAGVIYFARQIEDKEASFASVRWLRILGLLSFIVYLVHVPVFQFVTKLPVPDAIGTDQDYYFWVLLLSLTFSVLVSVAIHWIVEKPSLRLNGLAERYPVIRSATTAYVCIVIFSLLLYLARG